MAGAVECGSGISPGRSGTAARLPPPGPADQYPRVNSPANMQNIGTAGAGNGSYNGTDIKTLDEAKAYNDSSRDKSLPEMRQVDKKEIKETRP